MTSGFRNRFSGTFFQKSSRETAAATAGFYGIWVLECETTLLQTAVKIDLGAVQKQVTLLVNHDADSVKFGKDVTGFIKRIGEVKGILETAASTAHDADADILQLGASLLGHYSLDFTCCRFRHSH